MNVRSTTTALDLAKVFGVIFAGILGFLWLLVELIDRFHLSWYPDISINGHRVLLMVCLSVISGLAAVVIRLLGVRVLSPVPQLNFEQALVTALSTALGKHHFAEVIRIGVALIRPLFEEGKFSTRLQIGKIVEEAAALSGRKDVQMSTLIDAIGWSLVELGEYDEARRHIEHGLALSDELGEVFYKAKGQRHLGVIARRTEDYAKAEEYYQLSLDTAGKVSDAHEREVLVAGLHYAFASLHLHTGKLPQAMEEVEKAISCFLGLGDEYRVNMSYVLKGDIQTRRNLNDKARDTFRAVLQRADKNTEKLQVLRSCLGLAEIHIAEHNWVQAQKNIQQASGIDLDEFKAEAERLKVLKAKLPPMR